MNPPNHESYRLELRAVPGNWRTPPVLRLRAALKRFLRTYGLRCTRCEPILPPQTISPGNPAGGQQPKGQNDSNDPDSKNTRTPRETVRT